MRLSLFGRTLQILQNFRLCEFHLRTSLSTMSTEGATNEPVIAAAKDEVPVKEASVEATKDGAAPVKRSIPDDATITDGESANKKPKTDEGEKDDSKPTYTRPCYKKKKVALLMIYSGKGYTGMQMNPGMKTIERDLLDALVKAGVVTAEHVTKPSAQMGFQRAARTDKGVSAGGQVCSLKMFVDIENAIEKINSHLVDQIRVIGFKRVTRGFSSKDSCSSRTYTYMLPTFAFTPVNEFVTDNFKMTEEIRNEVNTVLAMYKGTHNFHNFTSGKKPTDPSAHRYIMEFEIGEPFMKDKVEYAVIRVKGQSFMLHQIRKMVGLMIAIVRGLASVKSIEYAFRPEKSDVPVAPSLGLMLDKLHYDAYNKRFGKDGIHEPIEWDEYEDILEKFKHDFIYSTVIETEKNERSMMKWLGTLHNHHFEPKKSDQSIRSETLHGQAHNNVAKLRLGIIDADGRPIATTESSEAEVNVQTSETDSTMGQQEKLTDVQIDTDQANKPETKDEEGSTTETTSSEATSSAQNG